MRTQSPLLIAANRNLARLASGEIRECRRLTSEFNARQKELRRQDIADRKARNAERRELKSERKTLLRLANHYDKLHTKGTITREEMGAYEEIDYRIQQIDETLYCLF